MPYSPLAGGHLARATWESDTLRGRTDRVAKGKYDRMEQQDILIVKRVKDVAEKYNCKSEGKGCFDSAFPYFTIVAKLRGLFCAVNQAGINGIGNGHIEVIF